MPFKKHNIVFDSDLLWNLTTAEIPLAKIRNEMRVAHLHSHRRVLQNNMHISLTEIATKLYEALNFAGNINKGKTEAIDTVSKKYIYIYFLDLYKMDS